jgi:hypothetical protein
MKLVHTATSIADAHMVAHELEVAGMPGTVEGQADPLSPATVWVEDDGHAERARALVAALDAEDRPSATASPSPRSGRPCVLLGVLFTASIVANGLLLERLNRPPTLSAPLPTEWDSNGDGKVDTWTDYDGLRVLRGRADINRDGKPDEWTFYGAEGQLERREVDTDFDGRVDAWERYEEDRIAARDLDLDADGRVDQWEKYEGGHLATVESDNDGDGVRDEWGSYRYLLPVTRSWSFGNDGVIDKRTEYEHGRRVRDRFDRDRDGAFDETVEYDRFERPVRAR